jgi:hypothetical protein
MQQCHHQVPADQRAGQPRPTGAGGGVEQHPAQDRGPQPVPDRRQQAAQDLGLDQILQRQPLHGEQRVERVPGTLQGSEPETNGGSEHHPIAHAVAGQAPGQQPQGGQLDRLLDQPHPDIGQPGRLPQERGLQDRGAEHAQRPAVDEGGEDPLGGDDLVGVVLEGVDHEGDRDQEAAEQDDGRDQVGVAGREGDHHARHPQQQTNK